MKKAIIEAKTIVIIIGVMVFFFFISCTSNSNKNKIEYTNKEIAYNELLISQYFGKEHMSLTMTMGTGLISLADYKQLLMGLQQRYYELLTTKEYLPSYTMYVFDDGKYKEITNNSRKILNDAIIAALHENRVSLYSATDGISYGMFIVLSPQADEMGNIIPGKEFYKIYIPHLFEKSSEEVFVNTQSFRQHEVD